MIEELFGFLVRDYGFVYARQSFENCFGGSWTVQTHSFYREGGCFTIYHLPQRGELSFYYAPRFSPVREELCREEVDICTLAPEVWQKHTRLGPFHRPFFWYSEKRVLCVLAEAVKVHMAQGNDLLGMPISFGKNGA